MVNKSLRESANKIKLNNKTLKLELDQLIIKGVIDQSYKILLRERLHFENAPSSEQLISQRKI